MKSILLASVSVVAFVGAAAAEVTFGGSATLGYNDTVEEDFYWEVDLGATLTQEMNNGLTAGASFNLNIAEDDRDDTVIAVSPGLPLTAADTVVADSLVLSLTAGDMGGLYFGDVDPVAASEWSGVDGSVVVDFNDKDRHLNSLPEGGVEYDAMLRGEATFGSISAFLSYGVALDGTDVTEVDLAALQLAVTGSVGAFNFVAAYQEAVEATVFGGAVVGPEAFGIAVSTTFAGAEVSLAYASNGEAIAYASADTGGNAFSQDAIVEESSIGVALSYPIGPVTAGAYYTSNDIADDSYGVSAAYAAGAITLDAFYDVDQGADGEFGLDATYELGNGIKLWAGLADSGDAYYVASTVDLGGGASLLVSYADDSNDPLNDAIGGPEYMAGVTAELSLSF